MGLRIIGGELKSRRLKTLPGATTRPTADRVREAIFNILGPRVRLATVLELFAGSGALGIEALSRGAGQALFVDHDKKACALIAANIAACRLQLQAQVKVWDIRQGLKGLSTIGHRFDLVFIDPPYNRGLLDQALDHLHASGCLQTGACLVVEHHLREPLSPNPECWDLSDCRKYGKTLVSFLRYML